MSLGLFMFKAVLECGLESTEIEYFVSKYLEGDLIARLQPKESAEDVEALMVELTSYCQ